MLEGQRGNSGRDDDDGQIPQYGDFAHGFRENIGRKPTPQSQVQPFVKYSVDQESVRGIGMSLDQVRKA